MGQYQRWLHHREVDQQLQAQLEALERELAQLHEHASLLEQSMQPPGNSNFLETSPPVQRIYLQADNQIIHALAASLNGHISTTSPPSFTTTPGTAPGKPYETISSALFAWSNLPNFGPKEMPAEVPKAEYSQTQPTLNSSLPPTPHPDMALLPEDMAALFDQNDQTEPQLEIPRWLRQITNPDQPDSPIDQETIRTNRLVQRWLERWGRNFSGQEKSREVNNE